MSPRAQHYDFVCDFNPAHQSVGNVSALLPPGWTRVTSAYNDARGNELSHAFTICPDDGLRITQFVLSISTPDSAAYAMLMAAIAAAQHG